LAARPITITGDLGEHVELVPGDPKRATAHQDGDGRAEQHAEGQLPALVLGCQEQEYHQQGKSKDGDRRDALRRRFFLNDIPE